MNNLKLRRLKDWATIVSMVAIPVILAVFGGMIQSQLANEGVRKDYVKMAVGILSDKESGEDMRGWAVAVLDKNSDVPFSSQVKNGLRSGAMVISTIPSALLTSELMEPPIPWKSVDADPMTNGDLVENYFENKLSAQLNAIQLESIQELIRKLAKYDNSSSDYKDASEKLHTKAGSPIPPQ